MFSGKKDSPVGARRSGAPESRDVSPMPRVGAVRPREEESTISAPAPTPPAHMETKPETIVESGIGGRWMRAEDIEELMKKERKQHEERMDELKAFIARMQTGMAGADASG